VKKINRLVLNNKYLDYFENPIIVSYFLIRELLDFYSGIKYISEKRDYYATLIPELGRFLDLLEFPVIKQDFSIFYDFNKNSAAILKGPKPSIKGLDPEGYKLLELTKLDMPGAMTFDSLKSAFRKAASKHHPDKGGSTAAMQIINRAYNTYHNEICYKLKINKDNDLDYSNSAIENHSEFIFSINVTLLEIYCDDWNLPGALDIVVRFFLKSDFQSVQFKKFFYLHKLVGIVTLLVKKLVFANKIANAETALDFLRCIYVAGGFDENLYFKKEMDRVKSIIKGHAEYIPVINHTRQAQNALSNGLISNVKFEALMIKFNAEKNQEIEIDNNLNKILKSGFEFMNLPFDKGIERTGVDIKNVRGIFYSECLLSRKLPKSNQEEYLEAFFGKPTLELLRKYTYVRLASYFKSLRGNINNDFLGKIITECRVLLVAHESTNIMHKNTKYYINEIIEALEFFRGLSDSKKTSYLPALMLNGRRLMNKA
jgi:hypothetical protein